MYKMIVVEDEPKLRSGICDFYPWKELRFEIVGQMSDGAEALRFLHSNPVDVVLTDIYMPNMDGIALAEHIVKEFSGVRIVFMSGYADFSYAQKALRLGVTDYLLKPVRATDLTDVFSSLRNALDEAGSTPFEVDTSDNYYLKIVQAIQQYSKEHLSSVTLQKASEAVQLSPGYLSTLYKQLTGQSFSEYLMAMRMREAKILLLDVKYKTYEISQMLGYENPKNFTRAFKMHYGISPREFKRIGNLP